MTSVGLKFQLSAGTLLIHPQRRSPEPKETVHDLEI